MSDKLIKAVIGAVVAVALAAAVSYGLIGQQTADKIQNQTNETLSDDKSASPSTPQQQAPGQLAPQQPTTQNNGARTPAPGEPAPPNSVPPPRQ